MWSWILTITNMVYGGTTLQYTYRQTSNLSRTLIGNKIVHHSDVAGASPVGAAPTTSSFSIEDLASMDWVKSTARRDEKYLSFGIWCGFIMEIL